MSSPRSDLSTLDALIRRLRAPDGCPWDREQQLIDLRAYLLEEAHETAEALDHAVETGDYAPLAEELGDLLFQSAFIARLAAEAGAFDHADAVTGVHDKMVARHPHVFGDESLEDANAVRQAWERRKVSATKADGGQQSLLAGVPTGLPALVGAYRLTQKAAGVGFDWPDADGALAKVREELAEVEAAREELAEVEARKELAEAESARATPDAVDDRGHEDALAHVRDEVGDLLFAVANVARKLGVDPEATLAAGNRKFRRRFEGVERRLAARGIALADAGLETMDALWDEVKRDEVKRDEAKRDEARLEPEPDKATPTRRG